jgi:hypothetical protein
MSGFTAGAFAGVLVQLYSNSVRKLPLMRRKFFFFLGQFSFIPFWLGGLDL